MGANHRFVNTRAVAQGNFQKSPENHSWSLVRSASFRVKPKDAEKRF